MKKDLHVPVENRTYSINISTVQDANICKALHVIEPVENNTFRGSTVRDKFTQYFNTCGAIEYRPSVGKGLHK